MTIARTLALLVCLLQLTCRPSDLRPFVGTWHVSGNASVRLGTNATLRTLSRSTSEPIADYAVTFTKGTDANLESLDVFGCRLLWEVSGTAAHSLPGQSCTVTGHRAVFTLVMDSGEIAVTAIDASHLSVSGQASGVMNQGGVLVGMTEPASVELRGTLTRAR